MSNLRSSNTNLSRSLTWNGRSLKVCSKTELIDCIIHLAGQVEVANKKIEMQNAVIQAKQNEQEAMNEKPIQLPV